jgi:hypothetical protein
MKSSLHRLIPFLPLFWNCQLNSIPLSQAYIPAGWRLETQLSLATDSFRTLLYNDFALTTQKTQPIYCLEGVFTAPLHSNGSYSIVSCVFVAAGICLRSRCLAMNVYSDFTTLASRRHVTIFIEKRSHVWSSSFCNKFDNAPMEETLDGLYIYSDRRVW